MKKSISSYFFCQLLAELFNFGIMAKKESNLKIITGILFRSDSFFKQLASELPGPKDFFISYGLPLMVVGAAGRMVRVMQSHAMDGIILRGDQLSGVFMLTLAGYMFAVWLGSVLLARLARAFQSREDSSATMVLIMAALTPLMLAQPLAAITPAMSAVSVLGLIYTVFLFGRGAGHLLETPPHKRVGFALAGFFIIFSLAYLTILIFSGLFIFAPA